MELCAQSRRENSFFMELVETIVIIMLLFFLLCIETWFQILCGINLINSIFHRYKEFKASVNDFPFPFLGMEILGVEFNDTRYS